jgi:hypothetical protein
VLLHLKPGVATRWPFIVAKWGLESWATQTPSDTRDVYFEEIWPSDATGQVSEQFAQRRGMWVSVDQIDALYFIDPPLARQSRLRGLRSRIARKADPGVD